jgi:hypothetical protein
MLIIPDVSFFSFWATTKTLELGQKRNYALRYEQAQLVNLLQGRMIDLGVNLLISIGI